MNPNGPSWAQFQAGSIEWSIEWENRTWGYEHIVGALENLGDSLRRQSVANILTRNGLDPAPERGRGTTWKGFVHSHLFVLAAPDFFIVEVRTSRGPIT